MDQQHLLLSNTELRDEQTLVGAGVRHGALLRLVLALKGGPLNAARTLPPDNTVWKEVTDILDDKR